MKIKDMSMYHLVNRKNIFMFVIYYKNKQFVMPQINSLNTCHHKHVFKTRCTTDKCEYPDITFSHKENIKDTI